MESDAAFTVREVRKLLEGLNDDEQFQVAFAIPPADELPSVQFDGVVIAEGKPTILVSFEETDEDDEDDTEDYWFDDEDEDDTEA